MADSRHSIDHQAIGTAVDEITDRFEKKGGALSQADALKHLSFLLTQYVERRFERAEPSGAFVTLRLSNDEVEMIGWLMSEVENLARLQGAEVSAIYNTAALLSRIVSPEPQQQAA